MSREYEPGIYSDALNPYLYHIAIIPEPTWTQRFLELELKVYNRREKLFVGIVFLFYTFCFLKLKHLKFVALLRNTHIYNTSFYFGSARVRLSFTQTGIIDFSRMV